MPDRYHIRYSEAFDRDLDGLAAYDGPVIRSAILLLRHQAEVPTRHRKPLRHPIEWCTSATWQLRVGEFRVLYSVAGSVVSVLRVTYKGRRTSEEMGP